MNKRIGSILIVCILLMMYIPAASAFPDIRDENLGWAKESIEQMASQGIITGFPDGTFKPAEPVTRLQAFILIARLLGVNDERNEQYVALAEEAYRSALFPYSISNKREVAYLLYKGVVSSEELIDYLTPAKANSPLKRYEAAVLLTKAMGKENEVKDKSVAFLSFDDAGDIPHKARSYVECVQKKGIMGGMSEYEFGPNENVTRAQMAVMLYRVMQFNDEQMHWVMGTVNSIDARDNKITITNVVDAVRTYEVEKDTIFRIDGAPSALEDYTPNTEVHLTFREDKLHMIEGIAPEVDETVKGVVTFIRRTGTNRLIRVRVTHEDGATEIKEYSVDSAVEVIYDGKEENIGKVSTSDYVVLDIKNYKIIRIEGEKRIRTVKGTVQGIMLGQTLRLRIETEGGYDEEYTVVSDVEVIKNSRRTDLRSVRQGDDLELTLEYNEVIKVEATSVRTTAEGTIEEIVISATPSIKIRHQGEIRHYDLVRHVEISINGNTTKDDKPFEIYDLRLGYPVTLAIDSDIVVRIEAKTASNVQQMTGSVQLVNESYRFLNIEVADAIVGETTIHQVFIRPRASIINNNTSRDLTLSDIKRGDIVTVIGNMDSGVFEANTIVVISD